MKAKNHKVFTPEDVSKIAELANLPISSEKKVELTKNFNAMMDIVEELTQMDTQGVEPTSQVTGLVNVTREDVVEEKRMLSQEAALKGAKNTYNGYFVVDAILEEVE